MKRVGKTEGIQLATVAASSAAFFSAAEASEGRREEGVADGRRQHQDSALTKAKPDSLAGSKAKGERVRRSGNK